MKLYAIFNPPSAEHPEGYIVSCGASQDHAWQYLYNNSASIFNEDEFIISRITAGFTCREVAVYETSKQAVVDLCKHRYEYFGTEQKRRRCRICCDLEPLEAGAKCCNS